MSGDAKITLVGTLARDPETKYTASGMAVTKFSIPVDRNVGGEKKTEWWNVACFDKLAISAGENLHKGSVIKAEGVFGIDRETMCPRVFEKDGVHRSALDLTANSLTFLSNFGKTEGKEKSSGSSQEELPF